MSKAPFGKFIQQAEKGAKKKERIRQEKKAVRRETQAFFQQKKAEAKAMRSQHSEASMRNPASSSQQPEPGNRKPEETGGGSRGGKKPLNKGYNRMSYQERKKKQAEKRVGGRESGLGNREPRVGSRESGIKRPVTGNGKAASGNKQATTSSRPAAVSSKQHVTGNQRPATSNKPSATSNKPPVTSSKQPETPNPKGKTATVIPLNKFIAHAGLSSRRDAAEIVKSGTVMVNGKVVTEPGFKVSQQDEVKVNGKKIQVRQTMVYILLNKPKDYITTTEDPQGRKTVLDLIRNATTERVYPIGRLDRNTTGVLLLTNDGELAQKLSHPSYMVKKIYEVKLDKPLVKKDFDTILNGIELEDGFIAPDALAYADTKDKSVIGIEIHSGRNRIVRRIFEHMGYDVRGLDRVMYANLTKKNVERGKWRYLAEKEVRLLKYLNTSYTKNKSATRG